MISGRTRGCPQLPGVLWREQTRIVERMRIVWQRVLALCSRGQKHCSLQRAAKHLLASRA